MCLFNFFEFCRLIEVVSLFSTPHSPGIVFQLLPSVNFAHTYFIFSLTAKKCDARVWKNISWTDWMLTEEISNPGGFPTPFFVLYSSSMCMWLFVSMALAMFDNIICIKVQLHVSNHFQTHLWYPKKLCAFTKTMFPSRRFSITTLVLTHHPHCIFEGFWLLNHWLFRLYNQKHNFCKWRKLFEICSKSSVISNTSISYRS